MSQRMSSKSSFRLVLVVIFLVAILLVVGAQWIGNSYWKSAIEHLGTALVIASFLGLTIDLWLKKQITEDVFSAAMGYELPEDLRKEIRAVYGNRVLCDDHTQTVEIADIGSGFVTVTVGTERRFKNISETDQPLNISIATDEWGIKNYPTKIFELAYVRAGERVVVYPNGDCDYNERPIGPKAALRSPLKLRPEETITVFAKVRETKLANGDHFYNFTYATQNPRVIVNAPGFEYGVHFAHRETPMRSEYSGTTALPGLLLPNQSIRIRWWKKGAS